MAKVNVSPATFSLSGGGILSLEKCWLETLILMLGLSLFSLSWMTTPSMVTLSMPTGLSFLSRG